MDTPLQHEILAIEAVDAFHRVYKTENDPYRQISFLGQGGCGFVDLIEHWERPGSTYARKLFPLQFSNQRRKDEIERIKSEAQIIWKLNHCHVVNIIATYEWQR
ncbi:hypothetical protein AOQ84DRAFT_354379 [Glonium stellatum]|uniref:Protein kinase domain-containing protein n=1 Tax=Glonium stellatum TaxID=574774 RepID=A0A8E2F1Q3_9PEZI|nr:hypothetical protein AOQ84DRAFT_354379 [Glonium stellatum]